MKNFFFVATILFLLTACSKTEEVQITETTETPSMGAIISADEIPADLLPAILTREELQERLKEQKARGQQQDNQRKCCRIGTLNYVDAGQNVNGAFFPFNSTQKLYMSHFDMDVGLNIGSSIHEHDRTFCGGVQAYSFFSWPGNRNCYTEAFIIDDNGNICGEGYIFAWTS